MLPPKKIIIQEFKFSQKLAASTKFQISKRLGALTEWHCVASKVFGLEAHVENDMAKLVFPNKMLLLFFLSQIADMQ